MNPIYDIITEFILSDSLTLSRIDKYSIFGTLIFPDTVEMIPLYNKRRWLRFLAHPNSNKLIIYICDYHHSFYLTSLPKTPPPWPELEDFIQYCEKTNVDEDHIDKMIEILSNGMPIYLIDKKSLMPI